MIVTYDQIQTHVTIVSDPVHWSIGPKLNPNQKTPLKKYLNPPPVNQYTARVATTSLSLFIVIKLHILKMIHVRADIMQLQRNI